MKKTIITIIYKYKEAKRLIQLNDNYLKPGIYMIDVLNDSAKKINTNFDVKYKYNPKGYQMKEYSFYKKFIGPLFFKFISIFFLTKVEGEKPMFSGQYILFCRNKKFISFDLEKKKILIKYTTKEGYRNAISNYCKFAKHFELPKISYKDKRNLLYVEEYISNSNLTLDAKKTSALYERLIEDYMSYVLNNNSIAEMYNVIALINNFRISELQKQQMLNYIENNDMANIDIPYIEGHGDFSFKNVIVSKNRPYIIDWDLQGSYSIYYDLFYFLYSEIKYKNSYMLVEKYLKGDYDLFFKELFQNYNVPYSKDQRLFYFKLFIFEYISNREFNTIEKQQCINILKVLEESLNAATVQG